MKSRQLNMKCAVFYLKKILLQEIEEHTVQVKQVGIDLELKSVLYVDQEIQ